MNEKQDSIIKKANYFIKNARYELSLTQQKLILFVMAKVKTEDPEFLEYKIPILEMVKATGLSPEGAYTRIEKEAIALMKKVWTIEAYNEAGAETRTSLAWFASFYHEKGAGEVRVSFAPRLKPYLLQMKKCFTTYKLEYVLALRSTHSVRLYEYLKMKEGFRHEVYFDLEEFKEIFQLANLPCYRQYGNIKSLFLLPSKKEITANTDLEIVRIKENKPSHRVVGFTIFFKEQIPPKEKEIRAETLKSLASSATYDEILANFDPDPIIFPEPQK